MDLGSLFGGVGNFLGGLFGNNQKKKKDEQPQAQQISVQQPTIQQRLNNSLQPTGVKMPGSLLEPQQNNFNTMPTLGGVNQNTPDTKSVIQAQQSLKSGGSGAPFKPEVINAAQKLNNTPTPTTAPKPTGIDYSNPLTFAGEWGKEWLKTAANGVNDMVIKPVVNTAQAGGDIIAGGIARATGNKEMQKRADAAFEQNWNGSIPGSVTNWIAPLGASIAYNQQYDEITKNPNYTPEQKTWLLAQLTDSLNQETAKAGVNTNNEAWQNNLNIGIGAASLPLTMVGAADGINKVVATPKTIENMLTNQLTKGVVNSGDNLIDDLARGASESDIAGTTKTPVLKSPVDVPGEAPIPEKPTGAISSVPSVAKAPAITSPAQEAAAAASTRPVPNLTIPEVAGNQSPTVNGIRMPEVQTPKTAVKLPTADEATAAAQQAIDAAATKPPVQPAAADLMNLESPKAAEAQAIASQMAPTNAEAVAAETAAKVKAQAVSQAAVPTETPKLGDIMHKSIVDGSINTPEGIDNAIALTRKAANEESKAAGDTLSNIIKKGQAIWEESKRVKHDLDAREVLDHDPSFTIEQQNVYQKYAQEISVLRDRSGLSLNGGDQGKWYAPQQSLAATGESQVFDPRMVNEIKRNKTTRIPKDMLDTSETPFEHAMKRYSDSPDAGSQLLVDAIENTADGVETGIKVPESVKAELKQSLTDITAARDEAARLANAGNINGAKALAKQVQNDITKTFTKFMNDIPGSGSARQKALNNVKSLRDTYTQSTMQTLSLSNVINRVADQGTRLAYAAEQPLTRGLEKAFNPLMKSKAMPGTEALGLNTSKEAIKASKLMAKGTLVREVADNFKANMSFAGAGRNPLMKGIAKLEAAPRALSAAVTQFGDLSTQNVRKALQLGASRAEAAGLKTVDDYVEYYGKYMKTKAFKEDLASVQSMNNPRIGLAGSKHDNMNGGGKISNAMSKYGDNIVRTGANKLETETGIKLPKRLVTEANDYVKGNITGYAGVGSRVAGTVGNAALGGLPRVFKAIKMAGSGDPTAVAHATQYAAQSVADGIAAWGTAVAAYNIAKSSDGAIGFTGAQPKQGSSDAAYNKANNIPANQWYLNLPNGKRVYFDPSRPLGAPGVAADIAGGLAKDAPADAAANAFGQTYNQTGGNSLPENLMYAKTAFMDPSAPEGDKKFAKQQIDAMFAPSTGILNNVANWQDPTKRAPTNFVEDIKANIPVLRSGVPAAEDSRGNEISNSKQISGGSGLFSVADNPDAGTKQAADPLGSEITRLQKISGDVFPTNANTNAKKTNTDMFGKLLLNSPEYNNADDNGKAAMMKEILSGATTKDINESLSEKDQQALLSYKLQDKQAESWLDDNTNASSYNTAVYDNAKANKTVTKADEDLENPKGLRYKAIASQVDEKVKADYKLKADYADISQSAFTALLNPKSDTYDEELANKVYDYDQARVAAGLPPKYNLAKAQKSIGGSGKKDFSFASLPSSLIGGTNSSGASYLSDAPTFKPIADLQSSTGAQIPRGRTISVKKGIQL